MGKAGVIPENKVGHKVPALQKEAGRDLQALANVYLATQVSPTKVNTRDAKQRDLQRFLDFYFGVFEHYDPQYVFKATVEQYMEWLQQDRGEETFSQATVARNYNTVRHWLRWAHRLEVCRFPLGCPTDGVKPPPEPEGDWKGLYPEEKLRLLAAARARDQITHPGPHQGTRDMTLVDMLLGTGLRISELLGCDAWQIRKRKLVKVRLSKSGELRDVIMSADARRSLAAWMEVRGEEAGPIFLTKTGNRLGRKQAWAILKRMEHQANAHVSDEKKIKVHPHALRHTRLRQVTEKEGHAAGLKVSGHKSDRYIWRYTTPPQQELEERLSKLN